MGTTDIAICTSLKLDAGSGGEGKKEDVGCLIHIGYLVKGELDININGHDKCMVVGKRPW